MLRHDLVRSEFVHPVNELLLIVVASLPRAVQEDHQRVFLFRFVALWFQQPVRQLVVAVLKRESLKAVAVVGGGNE
jgi:hypothetical protein